MMIVGSKRKRISSPGVAAVEMAVTLPLVLTLLIGTWEVGRILEIQQILNMGARSGPASGIWLAHRQPGTAGRDRLHP